MHEQKDQKHVYCHNKVYYKKLKTVISILIVCENGLVNPLQKRRQTRKIKVLKSDSHLSKNLFLFASMKTLPNWWIMLFISS